MNVFMFAYFGITEFWILLLGTIFIVLLLGPNSMYVSSVAARHGARAGYQGARDVFLGNTILMVLSAAGVASLLKASPTLFHVVKYIGAAYLAWTGLQILRGTVRNWRVRKASESVAQDAAPADESHPFKKVLIISLLNPKAILFLISLFIQFADPHYTLPAVSFVVPGLVCQICSFLYPTTTIFVGARLVTAFRTRRRLFAGMSNGAGAMLTGFSVKLAMATLN